MAAKKKTQFEELQPLWADYKKTKDLSAFKTIGEKLNLWSDEAETALTTYCQQIELDEQQRDAAALVASQTVLGALEEAVRTQIGKLAPAK